MSIRKNILQASARAILIILIVFIMFSVLVLFPSAARAQTGCFTKGAYYLYQVLEHTGGFSGSIKPFGVYENDKSCQKAARELGPYIESQKRRLICLPASST